MDLVIGKLLVVWSNLALELIGLVELVRPVG